MRCCLVAPKLPPSICGVGDYSARLAVQLSKLGLEIVALTGSDQAPAPAHSPFRVHNEIPGWNLLHTRAFFRAIDKIKPDVVLLEWVPYLYQRRGENLGVAFWMALLRLRGIRVVTTVHEIAAPLFKYPWLHSPLFQWASILILGIFSTKLIFILEIWAVAARRFFWWKKKEISFAPCFATIETVPFTSEQRVLFRKQEGIPPAAVLLCNFSPNGSGKNHEGFEKSSLELLTHHPNIHIVLLGNPKEAVHKRYPSLTRHPQVHVTGVLDSPAVSRWIQSSDAGYSLFIDGVSERRTTVISCLAHNIPVLVNSGPSTPRWMRSNPWLISVTESGSDLHQKVSELKAPQGAEIAEISPPRIASQIAQLLYS